MRCVAIGSPLVGSAVEVVRGGLAATVCVAHSTKRCLLEMGLNVDVINWRVPWNKQVSRYFWFLLPLSFLNSMRTDLSHCFGLERCCPCYSCCTQWPNKIPLNEVIIGLCGVITTLDQREIGKILHKLLYCVPAVSKIVSLLEMFSAKKCQKYYRLKTEPRARFSNVQSAFLTVSLMKILPNFIHNPHKTHWGTVISRRPTWEPGSGI